MNYVTSTTSDRLDKVLALIIGESRSQVGKLITIGCVSVNSTIVTKPSFKVKVGDLIGYESIEASTKKSYSVDFDIPVLYEDESILILNKPAGVVVHPAPSVKEPTLVDWLIEYGVSLSTISGESRHGIVHRLDKETTGAIVIAKSNQAHRLLSEQLKDRSMGRYYLALIDYPLKESVTVSKPIARNPKNRLKMAIVEGGKEAKTEFLKIAEAQNGSELISAKLYSGRTHQIRVHLSSLNRHILGDTVYGYKKSNLYGDIKRVMLHAWQIYLNHPVSGKRIMVEAPLFEDMKSYINSNFDRSDIDEEILQRVVLSTFDSVGHSF